MDQYNIEHNTQNGEKQSKLHDTEYYKMGNTDPTNNSGVHPGAGEG
jgi:hypothetical protein